MSPRETAHGTASGEPLHVATSRAIIYLRTWKYGPECHEYCEAKGYRVVGVVYDPDGSRYDATFDAIVTGQAEVIVAWDYGDLPADRVPRVEPVSLLQPPQTGAGPRSRRPRGVRFSRE